MSGGFCVLFFYILIQSRPNPSITDTALTDQTTSHKSSFKHVAENDAEQEKNPDRSRADNCLLSAEYVDGLLLNLI